MAVHAVLAQAQGYEGQWRPRAAPRSHPNPRWGTAPWGYLEAQQPGGGVGVGGGGGESAVGERGSCWGDAGFAVAALIWAALRGAGEAPADAASARSRIAG